MYLPRLRGRSITVGGTTALIATGALLVGSAMVGGAPADAARAVFTPTTVTVGNHTTLKITAKGQGHGHGMSQWGAEGAALDGLSYEKILAFYYKHATLTTQDPSTIRVLLSGFGSTTTVAAGAGLHVTGIAGALPSRGISRYRLAASPTADKLVLQRLATSAGATWQTVDASVRDHSAFYTAGGGATRIFAHNGTSNSYYGKLRTTRRSATRVMTVNQVLLDQYTAGVVPNESPTYWKAAALDAQAVAARTYGAYAVAHPENPRYDICDTTSCQVYDGHMYYNKSGTAFPTDYPAAATATADQILTYQGSAIFAQFSASNGGWEASGGEPYLPAQRDPYDTGKSGDPWISYSQTVTTASIAAAYGLSKLTKITIDSRDGNGTWGGRVDDVTLTGTSGGKTTTVQTTGVDLQWTLGLGTDWYTISA